jgi:hypothetical protein
MNPYMSNKTALEILEEIEARIAAGWRLEDDLKWIIEKIRENLK